MPAYCAFHGTRRRAWASPLVDLSETGYGKAAHAAQHAHLHATVAFVVAGGFRERQGSRQVECSQADLLLRPAGVEHEDFFADRATACFNVEIAAELAGERRITGACVRGGQAEWLAVKLLQELRVGSSTEPLSLEARVADLLDALCPAPSSPIPERVARIVSLLRDGPAERWSLRELAAEAGVHPMHLTRAFRRHCGQSVGQVQRRVRVERACRLLVETARPLADVAQSVGFADQAHLTRVFRTHTGMTPARYRSLFREEHTLRSFKT